MLQEFLAIASTIFDNNFGPAILAWSSMYAMTMYKKILKEIDHFNLPVLHGLSGFGERSVKRLLTGCLVTANFDVSKLCKSFKQLVVFPVNTLNREKQIGEGKFVQDLAHTASSALPAVMSALNSIHHKDIIAEVARLPDIDRDNRVQEGIAVPLLVARIVLNLCGCNHFMLDVDQYVRGEIATLLQRCIVKESLENLSY
ncbi:unnamed protein product [Mytilus coruscus]|uniref:Uncharacterized protein n=1 Tax=Mytilus coruscus TaxID=42192 RepID=A0A6J7ZVG1_MYTCO|nr:unnamed protein product [Mytilus coruscus]